MAGVRGRVRRTSTAGWVGVGSRRISAPLAASLSARSSKCVATTHFCDLGRVSLVAVDEMRLARAVPLGAAGETPRAREFLRLGPPIRAPRSTKLAPTASFVDLDRWTGL